MRPRPAAPARRSLRRQDNPPRRADLVRLVGEARVQRAAVGRRRQRDRAHAEPPRRADDAAGDLAAIGDKHVGEHGGPQPGQSYSGWRPDGQRRRLWRDPLRATTLVAWRRPPPLRNSSIGIGGCRPNRRRLQRELGHSRLSRRRRRLEARAASHLPGLHGPGGDPPALLGAQPDRLATHQPGPAERRASRAGAARGDRQKRDPAHPERRPTASGRRQRNGDRPARSPRPRPLHGLWAGDAASRFAGRAGAAEPAMARARRHRRAGRRRRSRRRRFSTFAVPACARCGGVFKPDVVFFGENVPRPRVEAAMRHLEEADAMLIVGSSLMVYSGFRFVEHGSSALASPPPRSTSAARAPIPCWR